jgi:hypothetical protein
MIDRDHALSVTKQAEAAGLGRRGLFHLFPLPSAEREHKKRNGNNDVPPVPAVPA